MDRLLRYLLIQLLKVYKICISPLLGNNCRFYPSCSCYATQALQKYSLFTALKKITLRLLKCHPFHKGGVDLP